MTGRSWVVDQTSRLNSPMACGMSMHGPRTLDIGMAVGCPQASDLHEYR